MRQVRLLVVAAAVGLAAGCTPPELMQPELDDAGGGDAGLSDQVAFGQVAEVIRGSCAATAACHGESSFTNFIVEGGAMATDAQVRASVEDVRTLDDRALVTPGDAEASALYLRLIETGARQMPPAGQPQLDEEQIETVRLWVEQGARYE